MLIVACVRWRKKREPWAKVTRSFWHRNIHLHFEFIIIIYDHVSTGIELKYSTANRICHTNYFITHIQAKFMPTEKANESYAHLENATQALIIKPIKFWVTDTHFFFEKKKQIMKNYVIWHTDTQRLMQRRICETAHVAHDNKICLALYRMHNILQIKRKSEIKL